MKLLGRDDGLHIPEAICVTFLPLAANQARKHTHGNHDGQV